MHGIGTKMSMFIRTDFFTKGQRQCRGERAFETNVLAQLAVHVLKNEPGSIPCHFSTVLEVKEIKPYVQWKLLYILLRNVYICVLWWQY